MMKGLAKRIHRLLDFPLSHMEATVGERAETNMVSQPKLDRLREVITENLRVQRDNSDVDYINVGTALQDACSKQNHAIFARRGCGKTLLLHHSSRKLKKEDQVCLFKLRGFQKTLFPQCIDRDSSICL